MLDDMLVFRGFKHQQLPSPIVCNSAVACSCLLCTWNSIEGEKKQQKKANNVCGVQFTAMLTAIINLKRLDMSVWVSPNLCPDCWWKCSHFATWSQTRLIAHNYVSHFPLTHVPRAALFGTSHSLPSLSREDLDHLSSLYWGPARVHLCCISCWEACGWAGQVLRWY